MKLLRHNTCKWGFAVMLLISGLISACKREGTFPFPKSAGAVADVKVDFTRYISVGNSLTAGFADGGLYREAQQFSYPAIIAQQMQKTGGKTFAQPLFGTAEANGSGYLQLSSINADGTPGLTSVTTGLAIRGVQQVGNRTVTLFNKFTGDNNNYGVPGIKLADIDDTNYGNTNGYFERLLEGNSPSNNISYLNYITKKPFTFFTNWLGNNDALSFATSGGVDTLTSKVVFEKTYSKLLNRLTDQGAKGVVATIPDVTVIPYLHAIDMATVIAGAKKINAAAKVYISARDASGSYSVREAKPADLLVLNFPVGNLGKGALPYGLLPTNPIENKYVLDEAEIALAQEFVSAYNASIKGLASAKGLAIFDAHQYLNSIKGGTNIDGVNVSAAYLTGGIFSVDGIHLTPRGYAIIANQFLSAINIRYGTTLTPVNISAYRTLKQ